MIRLAAWNVNSVRVRLAQVLAWLDSDAADVLCLQETKVTDDAFPREAFAARGWNLALHGQRAYNGVAIASRLPLLDVVCGIPDRADEQARVVAATIQNPADPALAARVVAVYAPNGREVGHEKYDYKLDWFADCARYLAALAARGPRVAALGDFNVAPADADIYDPAAWGEGILASPPERRAFAALLAAGYVDSFRLFAQPAGVFSWWDYRGDGFGRGRGLRIDHILLAREWSARCRACRVDAVPRGWERPFRSRSGCGRRRLVKTCYNDESSAGLPARRRREPGQIRKKAALTVLGRRRGHGSPPSFSMPQNAPVFFSPPSPVAAR